jgi:hypothetical protein
MGVLAIIFTIVFVIGAILFIVGISFIGPPPVGLTGHGKIITIVGLVFFVIGIAGIAIFDWSHIVNFFIS